MLFRSSSTPQPEQAHGVIGVEAFQPRERGAAGGEEILAVRLEEAQRRLPLDERAIVGRAQPDADRAAIERARRPHGASLPPSFSQVPLGTYFHSSGALSLVALPAQEWRDVPQSF